jgi:hypothetical protein
MLLAFPNHIGAEAHLRIVRMLELFCYRTLLRSRGIDFTLPYHPTVRLIPKQAAQPYPKGIAACMCTRVGRLAGEWEI